MDIQSFQQTYLQVEQINKGGTGTIYRAYHRNLGKYVVLKNIELGDIGIKRREVDILKNLRHRYLPVIYDFIEVNGKQYIVEDYIRGTDLETYFKNRVRIPEEQIIKWIGQMCEVLEYLHTRKPTIIHSDIKPGNIMIDEHGDICLIDFNISILHDNNAVVLGYSNYFCSPEQMAQVNAIKAGYGASSVKVDNRSDIYSMAATFYAIISGVIPVCGEQNIPLSKMNIPYTEGFLRLIDKCMEISPSKRFQSAKQVATMLNRTQVLTQRYKKYTLMRNVITITGMFVLLVGILTLVYGENKRISSAYTRDYQDVSYQFQLSGANFDVLQDVQDILNEEKYNSILKKNSTDRAMLYAIEGQYHFSLDTALGYARAMDSYKKAIDAVSGENKNQTLVEKFVLNYITSAALAGCKDEAEAAVKLYFGTENTLISNAVDAEIAYSNNDYVSVISYANIIRDSTDRSYNDIRKNAYNIAALACGKTGDVTGVIDWCIEIDRLESTDESKRRLVSAYIDAGICSADENMEKDYFNKAQAIYNNIATKIPADKINYAQILYSLEKYSESLKALENIDVGDTVLLCKKSYILSLVHYEINAKRKNAESQKYCQEAVNYYNQLSSERKKEISVSLLENLMQILDMRLELRK